LQAADPTNSMATKFTLAELRKMQDLLKDAIAVSEMAGRKEDENLLVAHHHPQEEKNNTPPEAEETVA
jgi:hypothetical protein